MGSNGSLTKSIKITENEIIDANSEATKTIIITECKDIFRAPFLSMKLMDKLEDQVVNFDVYYKFGEILQTSNERGVDKIMISIAR